MKMNNVSNVKALFGVINECKGRVELVTREGDRLNLKSKLSQYVALADIFSSGKMVDEIELVAYEPEDVNRLVNFLLQR